MRPPYLLIDIDGVLIPFPDADNGSTPATHTRHDVVLTGRTADSPVPVWLNPAHGALLMDVMRSGLTTPAWCTSWRQDAATLIGPLLGLPPLPYIDLPRPDITTSHPNGYLWKRDHVDAWLGGSPAAWIDDDFTALDHEWAAQRTTTGAPTLLVQPDPYVGMLPEHLLTVVIWAAGLVPPPTTKAAAPREDPLTSPSQGHLVDSCVCGRVGSIQYRGPASWSASR